MHIDYNVRIGVTQYFFFVRAFFRCQILRLRGNVIRLRGYSRHWVGNAMSDVTRVQG
jgi:hypothetical protein